MTMITRIRRAGPLLAIPVAATVLAACGSSTTTVTKTTTVTHTASPTTTTAPPSSPTASFDQEYGTFTAVSKRGSGDSVVDLPTGARAGLVTATHTGDGNFVIKDLDAENRDVDLLVNTIGPYSGTTAWGFGLRSKTSAKLEIAASGGWTIKLAPVGSAPVLGKQNSGKGDAVCLWTGGPTNWMIVNKGEGNFVVRKNGKGLLGTDLLVNEIGNYDATKPVTAGPSVITINSDGDWAIATSGGADGNTGCGATDNGGTSNTDDGGSGTNSADSNGGSSVGGNSEAVGSLPQHCSPGLSATQAVSCELASNVFYEYYRALQNGRDTTTLSAWSPVTRQYYTASCSQGVSVITCHISGTTDPNAQVRITQAAMDAYTPQHASEYARTHDVGPHQ